MDEYQVNEERIFGEQFIEWFNGVNDSNYCFINRPDQAPDLLYSNAGEELFIEVTVAYYDGKHATFYWKGIRGAKDAPNKWIGINPNQALVSAIIKCIENKSLKKYGNNTVLLIGIPPGVTSAEELEEMLDKILIPEETPYAGIYIIGNFPIKSHSTGGYRVIPIKRIQSVPGC
jgi:hypothetical protein